MTDVGILWLSGGLSLVAIAALATAIAIFWRRRGAESSAPVGIVPVPPCAGPLVRLSFVQSLDPVLFAEAAEEQALAHVRVHLRNLVADGTTITLQTLRQWGARSEMVVAASAEATKAARTGAAVIGKKGLPFVRDKTGQFREVMKAVGSGRKAVGGVAAATTIVVSAAHMISAADLARTLKQVDQKLDLLLAYRRIDQAASLERIYTSARELLASPFDEVRRMEVWRLRGEMRQLRATWRGELEHHLTEIKDPSKDALFDWLITSKSSYDNRITEKISEGQLRLMLIEYSLRLDRVLATASDTWDVSSVTLADELAAIDRVGALLKEKAGLISALEHHQESAQPMIEYIETMVRNYGSLLPNCDLSAVPSRCPSVSDSSETIAAFLVPRYHGIWPLRPLRQFRLDTYTRRLTHCGTSFGTDRASPHSVLSRKRSGAH
jgi:hypothetical protein